MPIILSVQRDKAKISSLEGRHSLLGKNGTLLLLLITRDVD